MFQMKRSSRQVKPNTKYADDKEQSTEGPKKKCDRTGCPAVNPICFARATERCAGSKWTSRWYHVTLGEHYCNECFDHFYRSHKPGYAEFDKWKRNWSSKARTEPGITQYMVDQILPYWVQCRVSSCGKWRQLSRDLDLTPEFIDTFQCGMTTTQSNATKKMKHNTCTDPEDERVHYVQSPLWLIQNRITSYFKKSPAAPYLINYYADGVGLSPTEKTTEFTKEQKKNLCPYASPFLKGEYPLQAFVVTPDMMVPAEIEEFPLMAQECPYVYLAIRNLVLAIWSFNPKEWVTKEKCMRHIICRGLARVCCIESLQRILSFLTYKNFINQGLLSPPPSVLSQYKLSGSVIVIGSGVSGLSASYHLNSCGVKVTVIEAKSKFGGRIRDETLDGTVIVTSGQGLSGCTNNPLAIIAFQSGIELKEQSDTCRLITEDGQLVSESQDRRIEFHYNAILDIVSEWRKNKQDSSDLPLIKKFQELHDEFVNETQGYFSNGIFPQEEQHIIDFHHSNLEYACGAPLDQVSTLHWDQNEQLPQFGGPHMVVSNGYSAILSKLAEGLDIRYNTQVLHRYVKGSATLRYVHGITGTTHRYVIVTLPLAVLKAGSVSFKPQLPDAKLKAASALGAGQVEKVILQFDQNFWSQKVRGHQIFGHVPTCESQRGLFSVFYSSPCQQPGLHVLTSYIVSHGFSLMEGKTDAEIVEACLQVLKSLFPEKQIPLPMWSKVTHWKDDPYIGMAYSFIPVGCDGEAYDVMAESVADRVYFAGEATNRQFPQTVTGAYLSGVREARKILDSFS
ncbi:unnamed protein product [Lymnaea stagnalis]|uniref:Amine oxidase n=1 Tax=Lymnaea stagnalis TaxID=6523 RepID=A0AAV2HYH1_LYMST